MITVVGAGPSGSFAAYKLANAGEQVMVLEEHSAVGLPVACTGLVTSFIHKILKVPENAIINTVKKARIHAPGSGFVEVKFRKANLVLDRQKFDHALVSMAQKAGTHVLLDHKFVGTTGQNILVRHKQKLLKLKSDKIIGADGPLSQVARTYGLWGKRKFWVGAQVRAMLRNDNAIEFFPAVGTFAWVVPESRGLARIGVLAKKNAHAVLQGFLKSLPCTKVIDRQAGLVPIYNRHVPSQNQNVYLVGDAAMQVKATTGGGIISGLLASQCLADAILQQGHYERLWKKSVGRNLAFHLVVRKTLDRFAEKDYNRLVSLCSSERVKNVLSEIDRDNPKALFFRLIAADPRLLFFARMLLKQSREAV
jgi:geranylgeranyl reductase family protein